MRIIPYFNPINNYPIEMKPLLKLISLASITSLCATLGYGQFSTITAGDQYIGGNPTSSDWVNKDVIGNPLSDFNITGFDIEENVDGSLTVDIYAESYFKNILANSASLLGTEMGDLFISVDGLNWPADTKDDYFKSPSGYTVWEYGISLGTYNNAGGLLTDAITDYGDLYKLDAADKDNEIALSSAIGTYRADQEVKIVTGFTELAFSSAATWFVDDDKLSITIGDYANRLGIANLNTFNLGFHWTMTCANDVIEFDYATVNPVPEPRTIGLMAAAGMLGVLLIRRRFKKA